MRSILSAEAAQRGERFDAAVVIGRFQFLHAGHVGLLDAALACAERVCVVVGSAHAAPSVRNPLDWHERAMAMLACVPPAARGRLAFLPVRDVYDGARWERLVAAAVEEALAAARPGRIALVGHRKDASSDYLRGFAHWPLVEVPALGDLSSSTIRAMVFSTPASGIDHALQAFGPEIPAPVQAWLRREAASERFERLREEYARLDDERARWRGAPYEPTFDTVDAVVRCNDRVLLIRRGRAPGRGLLALPGGFIEPHEEVEAGARRELLEETGLDLAREPHRLVDMRPFTHPRRSTRGRVFTFAHVYDLGWREALPEVRAADDAMAGSARWWPIGELAAHEAEFHDDHFHILDTAFGLTALASPPAAWVPDEAALRHLADGDAT